MGDSATKEMNSIMLEQEILETPATAPRTTWKSLNAQAMQFGCGDFRSEGSVFMINRVREWAEGRQAPKTRKTWQAFCGRVGVIVDQVEGLPCEECGDEEGHYATRVGADENLPSPVDMVDHPPHYNQGDIEPIDVIEDWSFGYHLGQVLKYLCRAKYKGTELEDLRKARWYLDRYIGRKEA